MKANELRIGNMVNTRNPNMNPFKIEYIEGGRIDKFGGMNSIGSFVYWGNLDIIPIQLNEGWLLNWGFKNVLIDHPIPNHKAFELNSIHIKIYNSTDIIKVWYNSVSIDRNFYYVHQIQNLYFSLTGEELA